MLKGARKQWSGNAWGKMERAEKLLGFRGSSVPQGGGRRAESPKRATSSSLGSTRGRCCLSLSTGLTQVTFIFLILKTLLLDS